MKLLFASLVAAVVATAAPVGFASASTQADVDAWCDSATPGRFTCLGYYWPPPVDPIAYIWIGAANATVDPDSVGGAPSTAGSCVSGQPASVEFHAGPLDAMLSTTATFTCL